METRNLIADPLEQAMFASSRVFGALMSANWDENPDQFHIGLDNIKALQKFLDGLRALQKVEEKHGNT